MKTSDILKYRDSGVNTVAAIEHKAARYKRNPLADMLIAWMKYAEQYEARYKQPIGDDGIVGDEWATIGLAIKRLLGSETGGLDAGSIASNINHAISDQGIEHSRIDHLPNMAALTFRLTASGGSTNT